MLDPFLTTAYYNPTRLQRINRWLRFRLRQLVNSLMLMATH